MKPISWRGQLGVVAAGYAAFFLVTAVLIYHRHMQYVNDPDPASTSGGMYAFGDLLLGVFIVGLFLIPTFLLVLVIRKSEVAYTRYSQALLLLSLTAPIGLVTLIPAVSQANTFFGECGFYRVLASPLVIVVLAVSRLLARFDRAKRLTLYALLIEVATFVLLVALFIFVLLHPSTINRRHAQSHLKSPIESLRS